MATRRVLDQINEEEARARARYMAATPHQRAVIDSARMAGFGAECGGRPCSNPYTYGLRRGERLYTCPVHLTYDQQVRAAARLGAAMLNVVRRAPSAGTADGSDDV